MLLLSGINPCDAKTTSIPIDALELWIIAVIPNPNNNPKYWIFTKCK